MPQIADESVAKYTHQTGMATSEQIEQARSQQESAVKSGKPISLCEALVQQGVITIMQREAVEKRLAAQEKGGIQQLGNYRLIKKLGEGGMGAVYLAEDTVVGRKVAVKILPKKFAEDPTFLSRFRREARAMGKLNHQNVVAAFDVGDDMGHHYYVMEYCEGAPLDKILAEQKTLKLDNAIDMMLQAARGLEHAHSQGIIHRDIKPANMFVANEGNTVKILDLGLSKNISDVEQSFNTQSGVVLGTPHYISPEQALGEKNIDGRTDIYSLGATFYHLLTGETPFNGPNIPVILTKHLTEQLPNPQDLREGIPSDVVLVLQKMMAKKPQHRHANCAELIRDLEALAKGAQPPSGVLDATLSSIALPAAMRGGKANTQTRTKVHRTNRHDPVKGEREAAKPALDSALYRPVHQTHQGTLLWAGVGAAAVLLIGVAVMFAGSGAKNDAGKKVPSLADAQKKDTPSLQEAQKAVEQPQIDLKRPPLPDDRQFREIIQAVQPLIERGIRESDERMPLRPNGPLAQMREERRDIQTQGTEPKAVAAPAGPAAVDLETQKAAESAERNDKAGAELRQKIEPSMKQNRLAEALKILEAANSDPQFADFKAVIKQEQSDIENIRNLRADAVAELRKLAGKDVTLKFGAGQVLGGGSDKAVSVQIRNGPALTRSADVLDLADVDAYAPRDVESLFRRGLMFMAADDLVQARKNFVLASKQGKTDEVQPYLARLDVRESGSRETAALELIKKADSAIASRNSTQAKLLIESLQKDFGSTEAVKSQASDLEEKLEAMRKPDVPPPAASKFKVDENFVRQISGLPPEEQFERVSKKLRELNPGFEDRIKPAWGDDNRKPERADRPGQRGPAVDNAVVCSSELTDISPLRALARLQHLNLQGDHERKTLADISALRGLELKVLDLQRTKVADLSPLSDMPLRVLVLGDNDQLSDLRPLKGMTSLKELCIYKTGVTDLSPLRGLNIQKLEMDLTEVSDLTPLQGLPLEFIGFSTHKITKGLDVIKSMRTLESVRCNGVKMSREEFLKKAERGELKGEGKKWNMK